MNRRAFLLQLVAAVSAGELLARLAPAPTGLELLIADGTSLYGISGSRFPLCFPSSDSLGDVLKRGSLRIPQGYVWE